MWLRLARDCCCLAAAGLGRVAARTLPSSQHTHLDDNGAIVVGDGNAVAARAVAEGPDAVHAVVERVLLAVRVGVPDAHRAVLRARDDHRQLGVVAHGAHVARVAAQCLHAALGLVVPHLDGAVVSARQQVRLFATL